MTPATQKVGRLTVAIGLVAFGAALLVDNLTANQGATTLVVKFWPLLLIGFGLEYLIRSILAQRNPEESRLRFDFGGAFLLTLVVMLSVGVTTFRGWVEPQGGRLSFVGPVVEVSETATARVQGAQALTVDVSRGSIRLEPNTRNDEVRVEATYQAHGFIINRDEVRKELEQIKLTITEGADIKVIAEAPSNLNDVTIRYTVYAPPGLVVKAETDAGYMEVNGYQGDLELSSRVGWVMVTGGSGALAVTGGSGSIRVHDFTGPVTVKTNVGAIQIHNVIGAVQADSGTGTIHIQEFQGGNAVVETRTGGIFASTSSQLEGDVILKTQTGTVSLNVPESSSMRATAQIRTGNLSVPAFMSASRNGTASSAVGTSGEGAYTVILEAHTGAIHFNTP